MKMYQINFEEKTTGGIILTLPFEAECNYSLNQVVYMNGKHYFIVQIQRKPKSNEIMIYVEKIKGK